MDGFNFIINKIILCIMKTLFFLLGLLMFQTCNPQKQSIELLSVTDVVEYWEKSAIGSEVSHEESLTTIQNDTLLNNIQEKITLASYEGFVKNNTQELDNIANQLSNSNIASQNLTKYWLSYISYYKTIIGMKVRNQEMTRDANKKGIEILESIKNKNSDDYALLVLLKGLSFSFVPAVEAPLISREISKLIEKGLKTDDSNFRVHYAQGSVDFYTPKEFGGNTKTEQYLIKAINLPEKNIGNSQLPTWGKEEAYDLLIRYCLRENNKKEAEMYFNKAKQVFPDSYTILSHQSSFKNSTDK
ncbi:MAG: hypothetical protein LBE13_04330 [Bacteroidales bacterium]|jgi:hypothetical protein|nr:hypothetical protein [Bacteroidales bacterium]